MSILINILSYILLWCLVIVPLLICILPNSVEKSYLQNKSNPLPDTVIDILENNTLKNIMSYLGDPRECTTHYSIRGLVVGDVQSGKTATYGGLICKAADAGYKVVIVDNLSNSNAGVVDGIEKITGVRPAFEQVDCCDVAAMESVFARYPDIGGIIHFAANKAVGESVRKPLEYLWRRRLWRLSHLCQGTQTTLQFRIYRANLHRIWRCALGQWHQPLLPRGGCAYGLRLGLPRGATF